MNHILHAIRNGKVLDEKEMEEISSFTDEQKLLVIMVYNDVVRDLNSFIQELLESLTKRRLD